MASKLVLGQPVAVNVVLCSNAWPEPPTKVWTAGFVLESFRGERVAVVKQVKSGLFEGCLFNFLLEDVRDA
jgi:hypothetical protein